MRLPGVTSIRQRLLALSAAISVLTLAIAGTLFVINDVAMLRQQMARDLEVLSVVVGDNSLSALDFDAPETAAKNLASLRREYQIRYAALYDAAGRRFASYQRDAAEPVLEPAQAGDGVFVNVSPLGLGSIEVVRTLSLRGQPIGRIFIHARTDELAAQLKRYALIVALLLVSTLAISLLLAWRLQRRVSEPILELAAKTRTVSEHADYSLRVTPPDDNGEFGILYRGFNAMLAQIERRDTELTDIRARLEQRVEERTRDLNAVVREQRLLVEALPLGIIHLMDRRIARANPRAAELFGTRLEEMIGRSTADFYPEPAAFEEVGRVGYAQMAAGGIFRDDRVLQRRDGSRFWGRLIGQYIDPNNQALGSIWILDDIDRDKALEERLYQAREAAEAANRAKDLFMANMSHELRTPLNAVLGFAQLLAGDARLLPEQREQVQGIRRGGERLLGLISELLDLARIEAGRLTLEPAPWDSAALLAELAGMFEARARQKGIGLEIADAGTLPPRLRCDSKRLHQVLANPIDNAIKSTDAGRVRVAT
ncbi:MAG: histidine kinase dimerization/phospho-acceptor domain-containing protein, partial [Thiohalocapsa sp.]